MTDAISQYARLNQPDSAVRNNADKVGKKANIASGSSSSSATSSAQGGEKSSAPPSGADSVSLSNVAQKAMAEPDFDRAKVESIKKAIADGQYPLDAKRIAESFMAVERMIL